MTYEVIKKNFDKKLWNEKMVAVAVRKGIITAEQEKAYFERIENKRK